MKGCTGTNKNMWKMEGYVYCMLLSLVLIVSACGSGSSTSGSSSGNSNSETAIRSEIEASEFFAYNFIDDESENGAVYQPSQTLAEGSAVLSDASLPLAWGRGHLRLTGRNINITIEDHTASVVVTDFVEGILFVDNSDDSIRNPWEKPFENVITRNAEFVRTYHRWHLSKISPVDVALSNPDEQTVSIQMLRASVKDGEDWNTVWETTSSSKLFNVPEEIPAFAIGNEILVEVEITNTSGSGYEPAEYVYLHRPGGIPFHHMRDLMFDDGTNGDIVAGDGIYSRTYTIGHPPGRYIAAVDIIDSATFMDESTPYNSAAWGVPYIVTE